MNKLFFLFLCFASSYLHAEIPENIKREYASKMHQAFVLQSRGKATQAFFLFKEGYQQALQAGESSARVEAIHQLFYWYRKYGASLRFIVGSSGISDEYRRWSYSKMNIHPSGFYDSEWGKDPEQASKIRDVMFAVGEIISGVFCVVILPSFDKKLAIGGPLLFDGICRMWNSMNGLITQHELSLKDEPIQQFQKWEAQAKKIAPSCPCEN